MKEKRLATILYADLAGFTKLTTQLGPEKITEFVNECFQIIDSIIHIHDGAVLRHEGDRVMAIFGYPKSQGYDSYCAVLSGLKIIEAIKELSQPIKAHVAIGTGDVICEDGNIYGPVIEATSQLEDRTPVGEIYINKNCHELNKGFFDCASIAKDNNTPYRVLAEKKIEKKYASRFLNRTKELEELNGLFLRSEKLILITGEPGVGKTRFVVEAIEQVNKNNNKFNFLQTSFLTDKSQQFYDPILKLVKDLKPDFTPDADAELVSESYNVKFYNQLCEMIISASQVKPLIIHCQYFERIDNSSLEFFKFFINNIANQDIVLIFETHEIQKNIFDTLTSVAKNEFQLINLPPLEDEIQTQIATELLTNTEIPRDTLIQATRCAGGNPLFLTELCNYIKHEHQVGTIIDEIKIPYRLKEIFNHLIDHIPKKNLDPLSIAAVYGYSVTENFLKQIIPDNDDAIVYAEKNHIIERSNGNIMFKNPFFRDELYNRIPKSKKVEIHRKIASILREHSIGQDTDKELAHHFKACDDYELALHYALKWAKKLKKIHAIDLAIQAYTDALVISKKIGDKGKNRILLDRIELFHLSGRRKEEKQDLETLAKSISADNKIEYEFVLSQGRYFESISEYDKAIELYTDYAKDKEDAKILERIGMTYYCKSDFTSAFEFLNKALTTARKDKNIKKEADILGFLGVATLKQGDKEKSLDYSKKALHLYDSIGDSIARTHIEANLGNVYYYLSRYKEALNSYKQALEVANKIGDVIFKSRMLTNIGSILTIMGEYEKASVNLQEALSIAHKAMNKKWESIILNNMGNIYGATGKYEKALTFFKKALDISLEIGDKAGAAIRYGNIADSYANLGQVSKAHDDLEKALNLSIELNVLDWVAFYKNELAMAKINIGQYVAAIDLAQDAINIAQKTKNISYRINGMTTQALAHYKKGEFPKALKLSRNAVNETEKVETIEGHKSNVYYTHFKILKVMNKTADAYKFLEKAYLEIKEQGNKIVDEDLRQSFYNNIKEHKEIIEEWEVIRNQK